jgi:acyl carrier protein
MIPSAFVTLEALPLTPNGKVDRRALPAPDESRPELEQVYTAPRSEAEWAIAEVWKEALQVEEVGIHDNFFDLGGHSLLLIQVRNHLAETFECEIPVTNMFRHTTVAALAAYINQTQEQTDIIQERRQRATARRASVRRRVMDRQATGAPNSE